MRIYPTKENLEYLFRDEKLTLAEIGTIFDVSRQYIHQLMKQYGIETKNSGVFDVPCPYCGTNNTMRRADFRVYEKSFCNRGCYLAYKKTVHDYRPARHNYRIARIVMKLHLKRELLPTEIVRFVDNNHKNYSIFNLRLFENEAMHLKWRDAQRIRKGE